MSAGTCIARIRPPSPIAVGAAALLVFFSAEVCAGDSAYTSIRRGDCARPPAEIAAAFSAKDLGVQECPAPEGWQLLFVASDTNSWLEVRKGSLVWSAERAVVYDAPIGLFPNVGGTPVVEWRSDAAGRLGALIFRVTAQDPRDAQTPVSRLFVVRLEGERACLLGRVATNKAARALADSPERCPVGG